jgi:hypothetical protein
MSHHANNFPDDLINIHHLAFRCGVGSQILGRHVFDAKHHVGFAGDRCSVRQPAGTAAHAFNNEVGSSRFRIGVQIANLGAQSFHGGEITEREVDPHVVVINGLGNMHDRHPLHIGRKAILIHLQLVGGLQSIVATDRHQSVDTDGAQSFVDAFQRSRLFWILQMIRRSDLLAGVGTSRPDDDAFLAACSAK